VHVVVNGETCELAEGASVAELLDQLKLAGRFVAVERNLEIVPRQKHAECRLADGDRLEIVTLVGGG